MNRFRSPRIVIGLLGALLALPLGACSSEHASLCMTSLDEKRDFMQTFDKAYFRRDAMGDSDLVLVRNVASTDSNAGQAINPDGSPAPQQIVHIRIFWKPLFGTKADHPANTNASVRWCLIGTGPDAGDFLEYGGSGLVVLDSGHDSATATIRTAWMKTVAARGNMVDPLGPSMLSGQVKAVNDPARVEALLAELKSASAATAINASDDQPKRFSVTP